MIDSRYRDFRFRAGDVVADHASSAVYALGSHRLAPGALDLAAEEVWVEVDGPVVDSGAAVLGHPGEAPAEAGRSSRAGWCSPAG